MFCAAVRRDIEALRSTASIRQRKSVNVAAKDVDASLLSVRRCIQIALAMSGNRKLPLPIATDVRMGGVQSAGFGQQAGC